MKIRWENDGVLFEVAVTDEHINLTCDAVAEGCWIPNEDWPEIRDFIDQALKLRAPDGRSILQLRCGHCGKTFPMGGGHRCNGRAKNPE
jgi:hypothetical protein